MMSKNIVKSVRNSLFVLFAGILVLVSCSEEPQVKEKKRVLPIAGERDIEYRMVNGVEVADTIYHTVPKFKYVNQDSIVVTSDDFKGKVWVVDFFFTHCPTICPPMTSQMKRLTTMTADLEKHLQFLSFSIDPENDQPTRLREYIDMYEIKAKNWEFMTGKEKSTHLMAKSYFSGAERNPEITGGFGHTTNFALVDKEGLVRGIYNGIDVDDVDRMARDIRKLLKYEYGVKGSK